MEKPCGNSETKKKHLEWEPVSEIHEIYGRQKSHSNNKTIEQKTRTYKSRKSFRCANAFYFIIWRVCTMYMSVQVDAWMLDVCIFNGLKSTWVWGWSRDAWITVSCIQLWLDMQKFRQYKSSFVSIRFSCQPCILTSMISPNRIAYMTYTNCTMCIIILIIDHCPMK